jgi:hypothetical protein
MTLEGDSLQNGICAHAYYLHSLYRYLAKQEEETDFQKKRLKKAVDLW